tara:strand:+ start:245 stop:451 length:207 start_codon:yes stop_codon:yes gene_type:complete
MMREEIPSTGKLLGVREACILLFGNPMRSNYYRLYRMRDRGELHPVKLGGTWWFTRKELEGLGDHDAE